MSDREMILQGLKPLFKRARKEGLWFWCNYQDMWFSPDALQKRHDKGQFIWGAANWELRDPRVKLETLRNAAEEAKDKANTFAVKLGIGADS